MYTEVTRMQDVCVSLPSCISDCYFVCFAVDVFALQNQMVFKLSVNKQQISSPKAEPKTEKH